MATTTQRKPLLATSMAGVQAKKKKNSTRDWFLFILMAAFTVFWLIPLIGALMTAIRTQSDITQNGFWSIPRSVSLDNFGMAWELGRVGIYLGNSFIITIP